ncbi:MAG TPA: helix-turn-helix domain-containing protein [Ignavibacteriaceae bacterium]
MEIRRMKAASLFEKGMRPSHVAKELGVSREAASTWKNIWDHRGADGLKVRKLGARRRLSERDLVRLKEILLKTPKEIGLLDNVWSLKLVSFWINENFGILYHHSHVSHLLRDLGVFLPRGKRKVVKNDG